MVRLAKVYFEIFGYGRQAGSYRLCIPRFCLQKVHFGKQFLACGQKFGVRSYFVRQCAEYFQYFFFFVGLGLCQFPGKTDGTFWLDENDAAGFRSAYYRTLYFPAVCCRNGQYAAVIHDRFADVVQIARCAYARHVGVEYLVYRRAYG